MEVVLSSQARTSIPVLDLVYAPILAGWPGFSSSSLEHRLLFEIIFVAMEPLSPFRDLYLTLFYL
jgi:hypothetical protein